MRSTVEHAHQNNTLPDEKFGMSELHVRDLQVAQEHHDGVLVVGAAEVGPRVLRQHLVALEEAVIALARREAGAAYAHVLHQAQVRHLVPHLRTPDSTLKRATDKLTIQPFI